MHLVGFTIEIYYDAGSYEHQILTDVLGQHISPICKGQVRNYHYSLCKNPEEHSVACPGAYPCLGAYPFAGASRQPLDHS